MTDAGESGGSYGPELVIGLVTPVGTNAVELANNVRGVLSDWNYRSSIIRVSELLPAPVPPVEEYEDQRIRRLVAAGNKFCEQHDDPAAVARLTIRQIRQIRVAIHRQDGSRKGAKNLAALSHPRSAYIIQSLKRPAEVELLREVYGSQFLVFASQDPIQVREGYLCSLALSAAKPEEKRRVVRDLIALDARDDVDTGQNLGKTYARADFFVPDRDPSRELGLVFGTPIAPSIGEYAMFLARAASARSLAASRKVGAAVVTGNHVIATGYNDVPVGQTADIHIGIDFSEKAKREAVRDTLERLNGCGLLDGEVELMLDDATTALEAGRLLNIIEFQRAVHAEASAMNEAVAVGGNTTGADLYVTTYPCHLCYKQALAAQIRHVYYIDPYPKSRAVEMFPVGQHERLAPYVGVAPRSFMPLFHDRDPYEADDSGKFPQATHETAQPQLRSVLEDSDRDALERLAVNKLLEEFQ